MATREVETQDNYKESFSEDELSSTLLRPRRTQVLKLILPTLPYPLDSNCRVDLDTSKYNTNTKSGEAKSELGSKISLCSWWDECFVLMAEPLLREER